MLITGKRKENSRKELGDELGKKGGSYTISRYQHVPENRDLYCNEVSFRKI